MSPGSGPKPHLRLGGDGIYATVAVIAKELALRGLDPEPLLASRGLHAPRRWLPLERAPRGAILDFVDACLETSGDPALHVTATLTAAIGAFELADYLALMAPTLGHSLRAVCEHFDLVNTGITFRFEEFEQHFVGRVSAVYEPRPHPIETECTFVAIEHRMRYATGGAHGLSRVDFSHGERGSGAALGRALGCPVAFGAAADEITIPRTAWEAPTVFRHPSVERLMRLAPPATLRPVADAFIEQVRRAVAATSASGQRGAALARRLGLSARSLQRRLSGYGLTVGEVLEEAKREEALRLLADGSLSLKEVSEALGFSEPSAFSRAFRRWTGLSPSAWRER